MLSDLQVLQRYLAQATEDIKSAHRMGAQLIIQIYKNRCTVNSSLK
jgi:hypothetical protein